MFCRPWQKPQSVVLCRWREVLIFQRETTELVITLHVCVYTNISHDLDQFTRCNAQSTCYPVTGCCLHFQLFSTSKNNFFAKKKTFDSCHQWKTSRQWWNAGRLGKHSTGQSVDCFVTLSGENEIIFKSIFLLVMMWMSVGRFFFRNWLLLFPWGRPFCTDKSPVWSDIFFLCSGVDFYGRHFWPIESNLMPQQKQRFRFLSPKFSPIHTIRTNKSSFFSGYLISSICT